LTETGSHGTDAEDASYKARCAAFYESAAVHFLLGDSWRPGGRHLTAEMLAAGGTGPNALVLDVACGLGDSADTVSGGLGSRFVGLDLSKPVVREAKGRSADMPWSVRTAWLAGEAQRLPFRDATFDVAMVQCAFSTFPRQPEVLAEIMRVLKPGGRLALADITLEPVPLPDALALPMSRIACLADALPLGGYSALLAEAGLVVEQKRNCPSAARDFLQAIDKKLLMARVAQAVGKIDFAGLDIKEARRLLKKAIQLVDQGQLSYAYLIART
jgi:arsenite methyltransferase